MSELITIPVDGVEIKFTVTGASVQAALDSYGLEEEGVTPRDIHFFDRFDAGAPSPRLFAAHVVLRLRGKKGKSGESTLKLRPADQDRLVGDFAAGSGTFDDYKVEIDWSREKVLAASMDAEIDKDVVKDVLAHPERIGDPFGFVQRRLLNEAATPPADPFDGLYKAGPITSHQWKDIGTGDLAELRAERWTYPGRAFLELSLDAKDLDEAKRLRKLLTKDLADRGLTMDPTADSKTETALRDLLPRHD